MLSCGKGSKGPRLYQWALLRLSRWRSGEWGHWLLVRRSLVQPTEMAYYVIFAPVYTSLIRMVQVVGVRWSVEESFELSKGEVGLDQYEVRSWQGWYRHITLAMLALAFLAVTRYYASAKQFENINESKDGTQENLQPFIVAETSLLISLSVPEIRRLLWTLVWQLPLDPLRVLTWSWWRRLQQARAKASHYKRRLAAFKT